MSIECILMPHTKRLMHKLHRRWWKIVKWVLNGKTSLTYHTLRNSFCQFWAAAIFRMVFIEMDSGPDSSEKRKKLNYFVRCASQQFSNKLVRCAFNKQKQMCFTSSVPKIGLFACLLIHLHQFIWMHMVAPWRPLSASVPKFHDIYLVF